jgi:hypothetical protein
MPHSLSSSHGKSRKEQNRSTGIVPLNGGSAREMITRRHLSILKSFELSSLMLQVEALLEDFERRTAQSEDKRAVCGSYDSFCDVASEA